MDGRTKVIALPPTRGVNAVFNQALGRITSLMCTSPLLLGQTAANMKSCAQYSVVQVSIMSPVLSGGMVEHGTYSVMPCNCW